MQTCQILTIAVLAMAMGVSSCATGSNHPVRISAEEEALAGLANSSEWRVKLYWTTETESNAFGFYVHRADSLDGPTRIINGGNPLHAAGTTSTPQEYIFYDLDVEPNTTYFYKLEQVDTDGAREFIVGKPNAVRAETKPISREDAEEIRSYGTMYRREKG